MRWRKLNGLVSLRLFFVSFVFPHVWLALVVQALDGDSEGGISVAVAAWIVLGFTLITYAGIVVFKRQVVPVTTSDEAARQYRSRTFVILAFANALALIGFVLTFLTESATPYYLSLALAIPGFFLAAPSRRDLARRQDELGEDIDLVGGLLAHTG